jgi:hypothetical protein
MPVKETHKVAHADAVYCLLTIPLCAGFTMPHRLNDPCSTRRFLSNIHTCRKMTPRPERASKGALDVFSRIYDYYECLHWAMCSQELFFQHTHVLGIYHVTQRFRMGDDFSHGSLLMMGLAKSRNIHASTIANVNRMQYARRADFLIAALDAILQALHAHVAAQEARALPTHPNANIAPQRLNQVLLFLDSPT